MSTLRGSRASTSPRRWARSFVQTTSHINQPPPPPSGAVRLTSRRLISLQGPDAPKFLQGVITNNVKPDGRAGFFAAFLTAQGRVLYDVFVYPTIGSSWPTLTDQNEPGYMLDVDADCASSVLAQIKKHKLRAKFAVRLLEIGEGDVWSVWRERDKWTPHHATLGEAPEEPVGGDDLLGLTDSRASSMGKRILVPAKQSLNHHPIYQHLKEAPLSAYTIRRYLRGIVEGQAEMPPDTLLPMNVNMDTMNAIDFRKGCYLGQELTIRTHHTGVVRKRVLPVALYEPDQQPPTTLEYDPDCAVSQPARGADIVSGTHRRKPGSWIASVGNIGLAMCRLERMTDLAVSSEPSQFSSQDRFTITATDPASRQVELGVQAFVPDWLRGRVRTATSQKRVE